MAAKAGSKRGISASKGPPAKKTKTTAKKTKTPAKKAPAKKQAKGKQAKSKAMPKAKAAPKPVTKAKATAKATTKTTTKTAAKTTMKTTTKKTKAASAKPPKKAAPPKPAPAPSTPKAAAGSGITPPTGKLSEDDKQKHWRALAAAASSGAKITAADLDPFTAKDLKQALKHNDRSSTGNRGDLAAAVKDNMMKGCPPRCPQCGGGRLRYQNSRYHCPGYMEDDEFINCSFRADNASVTRIPWKSL